MDYWIPILAAVPALIAALIGYLNAKKISEVHVLVNSKMSEALATIASLRSDAAASAVTAAVANAALETERAGKPPPGSPAGSCGSAG